MTDSLAGYLAAHARFGVALHRVIPGIRDDEFDWIGRYGAVAPGGEDCDTRWATLLAGSHGGESFATQRRTGNSTGSRP
ncbi:MAG: hypothetical protein M0Z80_03620 [Treponema sp.]|nr:hypothetical protein [Treponema sp.]